MLTRNDYIDLSLLAIAAAALTGAIYIHKHLKPLPLHRRAAVQVRKVVGR